MQVDQGRGDRILKDLIGQCIELLLVRSPLFLPFPCGVLAALGIISPAPAVPIGPLIAISLIPAFCRLPARSPPGDGSADLLRDLPGDIIGQASPAAARKKDSCRQHSQQKPSHCYLSFTAYPHKAPSETYS